MDALDQIKRSADTIIGEDSLQERLQAGKRLNVKLGVDPTRPDLTFGHLVVFNKLRLFQELGHQAVLIIGDFTTLVGDPSGRSDIRPVLTKDEIETNAATYLDQAFKVLDREKTKVVRNSDWFGDMGFEDCLGLARKMTVSRMLERDDFAKRFQANKPISIIEFLYPLIQGYDSLMVEADVELGGTDQLFNLLVGRQLQKDAGKPEQVCLTMPLLVGLDGVKKMSKSLDNYIAFNDEPGQMFGKIMSISDDTMWVYYELLVQADDADIAALKAEHPMEAKKRLAAGLVERFFGDGAGDRERAQFEQVFAQSQLPDAMPSLSVARLGDSPTLTNAFVEAGLFQSKGEVRRLLQQGGIRVDQQKVDDPFMTVQPGQVLQAGKRKFVQITE
ncbi:MAG: tyrosine--tRNA ligase [Opitutales bacterium]